MNTSQETYLGKLPGCWFLYSPVVTLLGKYTGQNGPVVSLNPAVSVV